MTGFDLKDTETLSSTPFGKQMRKFFPFDKDYVHLNNGNVLFLRLFNCYPQAFS